MSNELISLSTLFQNRLFRIPDGFTEGMYRLYRHLLDIHTRSFLFVVRPE